MENKILIGKLAVLQICLNLFYNLIGSMENSILSMNGMLHFLNDLIFRDAQSFLTFVSAVILVFTKSLKLTYALLFWWQVLRRKIKLSLESLEKNIRNMENEKENEDK
jgi:hypothetical protein